jgi:hypothetical protein
MVLLLDGRLDWASKEIFPKGTHDTLEASAVSVTLGAVVSTN